MNEETTFDKLQGAFYLAVTLYFFLKICGTI